MTSMKRIAMCGAVLSTLFTFSQTANAVIIDNFAFEGTLDVAAGSLSTPASITFPSAFNVLAQNGAGSGDLVSLNGMITGSYDFADPAGANTVTLNSTGSNDFTISDGTDVFSADIDLIQLQGGIAGVIFGAIDFSSSSYSGTNDGLIALNDLIQNTPNLAVTFFAPGFLSGLDLDDLFQNGSGGELGYTARVATNLPTAVPEPGPLALLGFGVLVSAAFASCGRSRRRNLFD